MEKSQLSKCLIQTELQKLRILKQITENRAFDIHSFIDFADEIHLNILKNFYKVGWSCLNINEDILKYVDNTSVKEIWSYLPQINNRIVLKSKPVKYILFETILIFWWKGPFPMKKWIVDLICNRKEYKRLRADIFEVFIKRDRNYPINIHKKWISYKNTDLMKCALNATNKHQHIQLGNKMYLKPEGLEPFLRSIDHPIAFLLSRDLIEIMSFTFYNRMK